MMQVLIYGGRTLENDRTLDDYGIGKGGIIRLVATVRGGDKNN
jgi:hypothetical protein